MIRQFSLASLLLLASLVAFAGGHASSTGKEFMPGKNYIILDTPVRTRDTNKIEVVEVFWYGCSHCYSFDPIISAWKKKQAEDVDFWLSPAMWNGTMKLHAQAFFTAKTLGVSEKLHKPLFTTLVVERKRLNNADQIEDLFADHGVDRDAFKKAFKSFSVNSQVRQADARARSYQVSGTPEVIVNGKYRVTARLAGGQAQMLDVIDFLVNKERALLAAK